MMSTQIRGVAGLVVLGSMISNCIAPPQAAMCPCAGAASGSNPSDAPAAKGPSGASNGPAPVKPSGPLISDGRSETVLNVDPPGKWFVFNDRSAKGSMTPASTSEFASSGLVHGAIHTAGKGFTDWGGGIGLNFVGADSLTPLDASAYTGISFKASGSTPMHIGLATTATMPEFGECTKCYDHFAADITDLGSTPKVYSFKWSQLKSSGSGMPRASLDPHAIVGLNFTSKGPVAWDFTLDDLTLTQ
jgi:hypothetical protein